MPLIIEGQNTYADLEEPGISDEEAEAVRHHLVIKHKVHEDPGKGRHLSGDGDTKCLLL